MKSGDKGIVFNIQRYSIHDGPGIRTIVFEGLSSKMQMVLKSRVAGINA